jgi:hypothetical protein
MKTIFFATILIFCFIISGARLQAQQPNHIKGSVELDPAKNYVSAQLNINYNLTQDCDSLLFFLHSGLKIESLVGNEIKNYKISPAENMMGMEAIPFTNLLTVFLKNSEKKSNPITFSLNYHGIIGKDEIILGPDAYSDQWVELGMGSLWFPLETSFTFSFTHELKIKLPSIYTLCGIGNEKFVNGLWTIEPENESVDMVIVAAKDLLHKKKSTGKYITVVFYTSDRDTGVINFILEMAFRCQQFYNHQFAKSQPLYSQKLVYPANRGRSREEGYSRNPFIMLSTGDNDDHEEIFRFIAHEIAHFWWGKGNTQTADNFMNESLAEYSYLMALRNIKGKDAFAKAIQNKRDALKNETPPSIWNLENHLELNYLLVYQKGPLLLYELEKKIGERKLIEIFSFLLENKINTLKGLVDVIDIKAGKDVAKWFNDSL